MVRRDAIIKCERTVKFMADSHSRFQSACSCPFIFILVTLMFKDVVLLCDAD